MFLRPRAFTTMNIEFNGANPCTPKNLAKQLIVESAKILNHQQRQALVDIFKTLDQAEKSTLDNQEYPEDWVKRTHQRPRHSTFTSNY